MNDEWQPLWASTTPEAHQAKRGWRFQGLKDCPAGTILWASCRLQRKVCLNCALSGISKKWLPTVLRSRRLGSQSGLLRLRILQTFYFWAKVLNAVFPWIHNWGSQTLPGESSYASDQTARDITKSRDSLQSLDEVKTGTSLLKAASINTGSSVTEDAELSPEICLGMVQIKHPSCSELSCIVNWPRYSGPRLRMLTEPHLMRPVSKMCSLETPNISD